MIKQATKAISVILLALLLIPSFGYSECGENSKNLNSTNLDISTLSSDELYQLYVTNVEMNNPYLHQMNHLGHMYELSQAGSLLIGFNLTELELFERAQEESYKIFKEWIKEPNDRKEFIAKMNEQQSKRSYQLASQNIN